MYFFEPDDVFTIKRSFSTLVIIIEISRQEPLIVFTPDDSVLDLLGFNPGTVYDNYIVSPNPVDTSLFDIFLETDIAQGMISKGKRTGMIPIFTMGVDPAYKYIDKFRGGFQWYIMELKTFSNISFILKNENGIIVSFDALSITFRLSFEDL